jgi:hypothetical protein
MVGSSPSGMRPLDADDPGGFYDEPMFDDGS